MSLYSSPPLYPLSTPLYLIRSYFLILSDVSSADTLSVSSQPDEVCARVLVRIADHTEVNAEPPLHLIMSATGLKLTLT